MPDIPLTLPSAAQPVPRRPRPALPRAAYGVASVAAMLLLWWAISGGRLVAAELLPSPPEVWRACMEILRDGYRGTTLWGNALSTLGRLGGGFGLAVLTGVPLGLWMGRNRYVGAAVDWIIQFLR